MTLDPAVLEAARRELLGLLDLWERDFVGKPMGTFRGEPTDKVYTSEVPLHRGSWEAGLSAIQRAAVDAEAAGEIVIRLVRPDDAPDSEVVDPIWLVSATEAGRKTWHDHAFELAVADLTQACAQDPELAAMFKAEP